MLATLLIQLVLPVGLLAWLALAPRRSVVGYLLQVLCTAGVILALALLGVWMLLPYSLPAIYTVAFLVLLSVGLRRRGSRFDSTWPARPGDVVLACFSALLAAYALYLSVLGIQGHSIEGADRAALVSPFDSGLFVVAHGGSNIVVNGHMETLNPAVARFRNYRGQSFGVDIYKINWLGFRAMGLRPQDPSRYEIFGEPVLAPCSGIVVRQRSDRPDMPVPVIDREVIEGNHVLIDCADFLVMLAHFQQDGVTVARGDRVAVGDVLGRVGNSGKTTEPHLHISAQRKPTADAMLSGEPVHLLIDARFPVRNKLL